MPNYDKYRKERPDLMRQIVGAIQEIRKLLELPDEMEADLLRNPFDKETRDMTHLRAIAVSMQKTVAGIKAKNDALASRSVLPEDFPARNALAHAGIVHEEQLSGMSEEDYASIPGIGKTLAIKIVTAERARRRLQQKTTLPAKSDKPVVPSALTPAPTQGEKPSPSSSPALPDTKARVQ